MGYNLAELEISSAVSQHLSLSKTLHDFDEKSLVLEFGPRG